MSLMSMSWSNVAYMSMMSQSIPSGIHVHDVNIGKCHTCQRCHIVLVISVIHVHVVIECV